MNEENIEDIKQDELTLLKERASKLGITYSPNIGLSTLRKKVNDFLSDDNEESKVEAKEVQETEGQRRARKRKEASRLVRVRVTNHNPHKRESEGEMFTASNSIIGTFRRYVHFGEPWHVEQILLNVLREREYQQFSTKVENGKKVRRSKLVKEFGIEVLDPLTPEELSELGRAQALRDSN